MSNLIGIQVEIISSKTMETIQTLGEETMFWNDWELLASLTKEKCLQNQEWNVSTTCQNPQDIAKAFLREHFKAVSAHMKNHRSNLWKLIMYLYMLEK